MATMTEAVARAAAKDAAHEQMRREGRTAWNMSDLNLAAATFNRLWPLKGEYWTKKREG
jgi:hypothetical protein